VLLTFVSNAKKMVRSNSKLRIEQTAVLLLVPSYFNSLE